MYDYASILFNGICNAKCPDCIGKYSEFRNIEENLMEYPLKGLEIFFTMTFHLNHTLKMERI